MRRLLCLAALAVTDAAAKFALEKKGQKVLNVKLYETGYKFANRGEGKDKTQTLREIMRQCEPRGRCQHRRRGLRYRDVV